MEDTGEVEVSLLITINSCGDEQNSEETIERFVEQDGPKPLST